MSCEKDHREFAGGICPVCEDEVDDYGNTPNVFLYCSFPDCGCDGARLCMAPRGPNFGSSCLNIERGTLKIGGGK